MRKYEFLNILKDTLEGEVEQEVIDENIFYYTNYIDTELKKEKSEEAVLDMLGEPRLIAKTIIDTNASMRTSKTYTYSNETEHEEQGNEFRNRGFHVSYDENEGWDVRYGKFKLNTWYSKMIVIILLIVILCIIGQIAIVILPIILPIIVIFLLVSYFTGNKR